MIYGIGIDIVGIDRIRRILAKYPERFPKRILHPQEYSDYSIRKDQAAFLARQFAAKEAVSKALASGFSKNLYPSSILIGRDRRGKPYVTLTTRADQTAKRTILVSISDEAEYAVAHAIVVEQACYTGDEQETR